MITAAFFDMDETLLRCNSGQLWMRFERERGRLDNVTYVRALGWLLRYKLALLDMDVVTEKATSMLTGIEEAPFIRLCDEFTTERMLPHVSPDALAAVEKHRAAGHTLAILTSATPYVARPVGRYLDIPTVLCTRLGVKDGVLDGTHVKPVCYGAGKVHWAERFAAENGIDLQRSYFYTDSYSDLPMLERVGEPRVVNPDARLARHAKRVGWSILSW